MTGLLLVLLTASTAAAAGKQSDGMLGSLGTALKFLSAQSVNSARAAAVPILQVTNQTALDARSTLQDLGGDVALSVVKARASGWKAAQCAEDKEKEAQVAIQKALARLDGCTALAVVQAEEPAAVIQNLTQEALQRIDTATGGVAACLGGTGTIKCLIDAMRNVTRDVDAVARIITKQALGAEQTVAYVARSLSSCAAEQVQGARSFVQGLDIAGCTQ